MYQDNQNQAVQYNPLASAPSGVIGSQAPFGQQFVANPSEPSLLGRTNEILNYIATAEMHLSRFRGDVFGEGDADGPRESPSTLAGMLSDVSRRMASICGELSTINMKMGINTPPEPIGLQSKR